MNEQKEKRCNICGKKSLETICDACKDKIQAEAFYKKRKKEKEDHGGDK